MGAGGARARPWGRGDVCEARMMRRMSVAYKKRVRRINKRPSTAPQTSAAKGVIGRRRPLRQGVAHPRVRLHRVPVHHVRLEQVNASRCLPPSRSVVVLLVANSATRACRGSCASCPCLNPCRCGTTGCRSPSAGSGRAALPRCRRTRLPFQEDDVRERHCCLTAGSVLRRCCMNSDSACDSLAL